MKAGVTLYKIFNATTSTIYVESFISKSAHKVPFLVLCHFTSKLTFWSLKEQKKIAINFLQHLKLLFNYEEK